MSEEKKMINEGISSDTPFSHLTACTLAVIRKATIAIRNSAIQNSTTVICE